MDDRISQLTAERDALRQALKDARPKVAKWCQYQGNSPELHAQHLAPIDAALDALSDAAEVIGLLQAALAATDRFFAEAMPKMNVADSCLDANAIDAWNKAEVAVARATRALLLRTK